MKQHTEKQYQTKVIAGKTVKVADTKQVAASSAKVKKQYAQALENLKNR